jgi:hypothetical protein
MCLIEFHRRRAPMYQEGRPGFKLRRGASYRAYARSLFSEGESPHRTRSDSPVQKQRHACRSFWIDERALDG